MMNHPRDFAQAMDSILSTPEGQQLLTMFRNSGSTKKAASALQEGQEQAAKDAIAPMLNNPEVQALLSALNKKLGHG